ncbi:receptor-like protein EIX2 isoform X2 [Argentina anserina]|uniref:receptor-like protein EIX2 isoform X2 n=1 Tax=Argentina anserina TaxID=57926 RepID=UPI00217675B8|nr:receptor-like protein EIX2 isoform X2 [Potentilla anserina]
MSGRSVHSILIGLVCLTIASAVCFSSVGSSDNIIMFSEGERHALLQIKQGLVDESDSLASWKGEKDCCDWRGIGCNTQTGHVTSLNISYSIESYYFFSPSEVPLRGEISPSLLDLPYLNYLDFSFVDFQGIVIPKFLGSLSRLKKLRLRECNFSGPLPPQLGNLTNLHILDLSWNRFASLENIEWLTYLSSLRYLGMSKLDFSKFLNWPQSLSKLTSLRELQLSTCNLPDVNPRSISLINSSTSLQFLDLSFNSLNSTSIFYWIANVSTNFVQIDLSSNNLESGIPKGFQNLCSLESLFLSFNNISGNIEGSIKALSCAKNTLEALYFSYNQFWGSIPELTGFSKLRLFDLSSNHLSGSLPESIGQLSSLEILRLNNNYMSGVITESHFRNLSRLQHLRLDDGNHFSMKLSSDWNPPFQLTGELSMAYCNVGPDFPKWTLTQTNIEALYLYSAGISGSLPHDFGDLIPVGLEHIDLSTNQIHGKLPNLSTTSLTSVDLSSNWFSGAVPLFPPTLRSLDLSYNMFSVPLSSICAPSFGAHSPLLNLDISHNLLTGELPNCWMQFQQLISLNLGWNRLSGKLPSSLGNLEGIQVMRLHENNFSGELPSFENCTRLQMVDLGNNNLSGKIPAWIGQSLIRLVILRLRSNEFNGTIPLSLCNLAFVHVLDLSHNNISGALPHCFNIISFLASDGDILASGGASIVWKGIQIEFAKNLAGMRSIDMSSNYLVGELPEGIASMTELKSLNLSRNRLTGKLPQDFGNMKMLESLDLSRNNLSGEIPASFSTLNFLGVLDVSHNQLSGRIPVGTQLQGFNASVYMGNPGLCGVPLTQLCSGNGTTPTDDNKERHDNDGHISLGFLISAVLGFITGFWVVCGSLLLESSWRYAYFKFFDDSRDWIYVKMALYKAKLQRRLLQR